MASELEVIRGDLTGAIITIQCSCLSKFRNTQEQQDNARGAPGQWSWHPRHSQHAQEKECIEAWLRAVNRNKAYCNTMARRWQDRCRQVWQKEA